MQTLVEHQAIDFRVMAPLILGLSKIFYKKFNYLLSESSTTLEALRHPFSEEDLKARDAVRYQERGASKGKKKSGAGGAHGHNASYIRGSKLFNLDNL